MAEKRQLEFFLLRYVPDAVKGEFVNIGLLTVENGADGPELAGVRFTKDWGRLLCLDPQADVELLDKLQVEMQREIGQPGDRVALLRRMQDSFSNVIQLSPVLSALTAESAAEEIETLARTLLETPKVRRVREPAGRQKILDTMRDEFDKAGVLTSLVEVPVEPYTKTGDPFSFDFGYRVRDEMKLFHAVSMRGSVDAAVMLAARYPRIAQDMARMMKTSPLLTAVVEAELDRGRSEVGFALEMMAESGVRVATTGEMAGIADVARVELGV